MPIFKRSQFNRSQPFYLPLSSSRTRLAIEPLEARQMLTAGTLDTTFGGGIVSVHPGTSGFVDEGIRTAVQSDGKVVLAGTAWSSGTNESPSFALVRYTTAGILDTTFGTGGTVVTPISTGDGQGRIHGLLIESDGKIVVAGTDGESFEIARYNSDGSLDTTFGTGGLVSVPQIGGHFSDGDAQDIAVQSDGKYVVTGYSISETFNQAWPVVRLNHDGSVDTSFGALGVSDIDFSDYGDTTASPQGYGITVQADQKIVVVGQMNSIGNQWTVVRYNTDGTPDHTFGVDGIVSTTFASSEQVAFQAVQQPDGKLLVAGCPLKNSTGDVSGFELVRYNIDGTLDSTFNGGTPITAGFAGQIHATSFQVALQSNGKIVLGGTVEASASSIENFALQRYNSDGSLDTTFGKNGSVTTSFDETQDAWGLSFWNTISMAISPNGSIVVAGIGQRVLSDQDFSFVVARFTGDPVVVDAWKNPANPLDVNGDGEVAPIDSLIIINQLNSVGPGTLTGAPGNPAYYYDTNGDGLLTSLDSLLVLNALNASAQPQALPAVATAALGVADATTSPAGSNPLAAPSVVAAYIPATIYSFAVQAAGGPGSAAADSPTDTAAAATAESLLSAAHSTPVDGLDWLDDLLAALAFDVSAAARSRQFSTATGA
jgi:uncharacterized delta-60 repeat protein